MSSVIRCGRGSSRISTITRFADRSSSSCREGATGGGRARGPPLPCEGEGMSTGVVAQGGRWRSRHFGEVGRGGRAQGPPLRCECEGMSTGVVAQGGRWRSRRFGEVSRGGRARGPPLRFEGERMSTGVVAQGGRWRSRRFGEVGRGGRAQGPPLRCEDEGARSSDGQNKKPRGRGASRLPPEISSYAWNDFPQPQLPVEFGFSTEKPAPRKSST